MATEESFLVEELELSEDSDEGAFDYDGVSDNDDFSTDDDDDDLEGALRTLHRNSKSKNSATQLLGDVVQNALQPMAKTTVKPSVIDDFIRNFLVKMEMMKTLDNFNREWYELKRKQSSDEELEDVPNIYLKNQRLEQRLKALTTEVQKSRALADKAQGTWNKFRKERDFHRMHHKRVVQEKAKLVTDIKRLKKHYAGYEPALTALRTKYESAMKDKLLLRLERDRLLSKNKTLEEAVQSMSEKMDKGREKKKKKREPLSKTRKGDTALPRGTVANPYLKLEFDPVEAEAFTLQKTYRGHTNTISSLAFHPKKSILATASDDETWKLWSVPNGELIMSGEGHKDWVSGVAFSPGGAQLASCSGDSDVKLWDFKSASCSHTFKDHTQAVWGVAYHHGGDFLVTCSMDHTSKLWDLHSMRCRQTLRGHVDSVNAICFQPFANNICTASGDKTVSLWDIRSGLCVQTFYGHDNSCNDVAFALSGHSIASCDADGVVRLWDVRTVSQTAQIDAGPHPINKLDFDRSGKVLAAASDDGVVKMYSAEGKLTKSLKGHGDAVQSVLFDPLAKYIVSASSDCTFRIWS